MRLGLSVLLTAVGLGSLCAPASAHFEVPEGLLGERIPAGRYLERDGPLPDRYWVDAAFAPRLIGLVTTAKVYKPGHYFLYAKEAAERSPFKDSLYDSLYARRTIRPLYRLSCVWMIATVHERLLLTRQIFDRADCYDSHLLRTESRLLVDTTRTVNANDLEAIHTIPTSWLWSRTPDGEPWGITLTYYLEITPAKKMPGPPIKRVARSLTLSWAACL